MSGARADGYSVERTSVSLPLHLNVTSVPLPFHSISLRVRSGFISSKLRYNLDFDSISVRRHFEVTFVARLSYFAVTCNHFDVSFQNTAAIGVMEMMIVLTLVYEWCPVLGCQDGAKKGPPAASRNLRARVPDWWWPGVNHRVCICNV